MKKLLVVLVLWPAMGFAQQTTINGSEHPELIPDQAAAIAVFGMHSAQDNLANTEKHHAKLQLSAADHAIYDAAMVALHNQPKTRANTYDILMTRLSPDGQAKLKAFIQSEKRHMQYHIQPPLPDGGTQ
jgi:hypothetical protein